MLTHNTMLVLAGTSLLGATSGAIGLFAMLRRRSLIGDALAHAALPGICVAFLLCGERSLPALLAGAFVSGVLGIGCVSLLRRFTRIKEDAAIGIVLSVFFGAGLALSQYIQTHTPSGGQAGLDSFIFGKTAGIVRQDVLVVGGVALACMAVVLSLYKEFKLIVFDPEFGRVLGWPVSLLDLLLMALIVVTVVAGLPAVGVVFMAAFLIIPAASARFWTERLGPMLLLSSALGAVCGAAGSLLSAEVRAMPAGPAIVLCGTAIFTVSLLGAPRRGLIARWLQERRLRTQFADREFEP